MKITLALEKQLDRIQQIFDIGRQTMRNSGNSSQWINGYPSTQLLTDDIAKKHLFILYDETQVTDSTSIPDSAIHGVFAFIIGDDPTYAYIEDGSWPNSNSYGTIHRIASDGQFKGILRTTVDFCLEHISTLRIDTHADNKIMQNAVANCGFKRSGIIYVDDGTPRVAFQLN